MKAAFRLLSSEDRPAMNDEATVNALRTKHSITPADRRPSAARLKTILLYKLKKDVIAVVKAFPVGSSGWRPSAIHNGYGEQQGK